MNSFDLRCEDVTYTCSLAVVHGMPCIPSLSSLINSHAGALLILMHVAIQIFYINTLQECLWHVKFSHLWLKQEDELIEKKDHRTSYGVEDKRSLAQQNLV